MVNQQIIEEIKEQLVKTYDPEAIYIGPEAEDVDMDILVVVEKSSATPYQLMVEGHIALINLNIGKNIFVCTKEEFEEEAHDRSSMSYYITHRGKKIYAKA